MKARHISFLWLVSALLSLLILSVEAFCGSNVKLYREIENVSEVPQIRAESVRVIEAKETYVEPVPFVPEQPEPEPEPAITYLSTPTSAKTYMDYRKITNEASNQWKLIHDKLTVCDDGMLRDSDGRVAVALGSYFGEIGSTWRFYLEDNGTVKTVDVIKTDAKADVDTEADKIIGIPAGDVIEFVIDSEAFPVWENGYAMGGNFNNIEEYRGKVIGWEET